MQLQAKVLKEDCRVAEGVEYVSVTLLEDGPSPLLQMIDYSLAVEEKVHKGKLLGKTLKIQVENIRSIFSGRPQTTGKIVEIVNGK